MAGTYLFDLLPESGRLKLSDSRWRMVQMLLLEFQPAQRATLHQDPPRISVTAWGSPGDGIAAGILTRLDALCRTRLYLVSPGGWSPSDFVDHLVERVPDSRSIVEEHLRDNDALLIHLLLPDLLREAVHQFHSGSSSDLETLLDVVDEGLRRGDEPLVNAICVSFVEHAGHGDGESSAFLETWPAALRFELDRQRSR